MERLKRQFDCRDPHLLSKSFEQSSLSPDPRNKPFLVLLHENAQMRGILSLVRGPERL